MEADVYFDIQGVMRCENPLCTVASEPQRPHGHSAKNREALCYPPGGYAYPARSTFYYAVVPPETNDHG